MRTGTAALIVLILATPALAQDDVRSARARSTVDVDRLPLDVSRIHRELVQLQDQETRDGLNLKYRIQVLGVAPPIELFTPDDNLATGPVPYGAPSHREIINHITPQEFRAPVMDFSALMRWLADRQKKRQ